ncbi:tape measure protein [Jiella pelagia]|uniref:Tape measure protein n=1 Tax=Jiella pelagia TaxID=2986949 RepID=A0ABY7C034_9HYPH|nr:tape measure protein [Jiella pelagia]WAP69038.1 tape measure protein [Jiella pelagia]
MAGKQYPLSVVVQAVDKLTAPMRRMNNAITDTFKPVRRLQAGFGALQRESGLSRIASEAGHVKDAMGGVLRQTAMLGAAFGGVAYLFKTQLVDTASEFERYGAILETVEGSASKAQASLDWVSKFAAKTPYEIGEVTDSFVKLRAYGLDPTDGLLSTLGDTSAAMGKPIVQAVEAIADAVTGENERLKEFGIKARKMGSDFVYEYTNNGKTVTKRAKANSREQIRETLRAIWNEKYAGAMERQSRTWSGMMSNLMDYWTRFKLMIMSSGVFEWLTGKLSHFLAKLGEMEKNGALKELAEKIGVRIVQALQTMWSVGTQVWSFLKAFGKSLQWVHDVFGSWKPVIYAVAAILAGPLIAGIASLTLAITSLGIAMGATPFGLMLAGIAGLVSAIYLLKKAWDWFSGTKNKLTAEAKGEMFSKNQASKFGAPANIGSYTNSAQNLIHTNNAAVTVDFKNVPQGVSVKPGRNNGVPLSMDVGRMMVAP